MEYASTRRSRKSVAQRMDEAATLLAAAPNGGKGYCVRFSRNGEAALYRGTTPANAGYAGCTIDEIEAARAKVRRVAEEGSRPYVDAMEKIRRAKAIAADAWNSR